MIKKLLIIILVAGMGFMYSCSNEDLSPILTFDKVGKGGYPRLVLLKQGEYDLNAIGSSSYSYDIELVDLEKGALVTEYKIDATFIDNDPSNGDKGAGPLQYKTFGAGDFGTSADGFKSLSVDIPATEFMAVFGITEADLSPGDFAQFDVTVTLNDGQSFTAANSTATVRGSAFAGHFSFSSKFTCPVPDANFVGDYEVTYEGTADGPFGPIFGATPGTTTLRTVTGSTTRRQFDLVYLPDLGIGNGPMVVEFDLVCTEALANNGMDSGLGCGGTITISQGAAGAAFDINDDSSLKLNLIEFDDDGGCGVADPVPITIVLTKL